MSSPPPYNIQWLNQSNGLQVNSRCLISFPIGKNYQDELWFDVIPMDACHILWGRLSLFDQKVKHNGYLNTYLYSKDSKKIALAPFPTPQKTTTKEPRTIRFVSYFSDTITTYDLCHNLCHRKIKIMESFQSCHWNIMLTKMTQKLCHELTFMWQKLSSATHKYHPWQ